MSDPPAVEPTMAPDETRPLPDHPVLAGLLGDHPEVSWELSHGQHVARLSPEHLVDFARSARAVGFEMCTDVTAVDHLGRRRVRFELVVGLLSLEHNARLRLLVPVPADEPRVPSLCGVYPGANFFEREVYDLFGISFTDHPDLTRILMPDDWVGHPLRKDFQVGAVPVRFKGAPEAG